MTHEVLQLLKMQQYYFCLTGAFFPVLLLVRPSLQNISRYEKHLVLLSSYFYRLDDIPVTQLKGSQH